MAHSCNKVPNGPNHSVTARLTEAQCKEYGYPEIDPRFQDQEWLRGQFKLDSTDPRHNPNLLLDPSDREFWYNAARKPFAKALLRSEQHWNKRRELWMKQFAKVEDQNLKREKLMKLLPDCSSEMKRLIAPIMRHSITTIVVSNMIERAAGFGQNFRTVLEDPVNKDTLMKIRKCIDAGGDLVAANLLESYCGHHALLAEHLAALEDTALRTKRQDADVETLAGMLNWGEKCKKDGILEWHRGNWAEAHASWKQASDALKQFRAPDRDENANKIIDDLHVAVLKNLSQACLKLGYYSDALYAAESATSLRPDDTKAWFRKACALERLGLFSDADSAFERTEQTAVGRPDRERIIQEVQSKRNIMLKNLAAEEQMAVAMLDKAIDQGVFSCERPQNINVVAGNEHLNVLQLPSHRKVTADEGYANAQPSPTHLQMPADEEPKLTVAGAQDLLQELTRAYRDTGFQLQVTKLARDVGMKRDQFLDQLKKTSLPLEMPILIRWGFQPSSTGVKQMKLAIANFTSGDGFDSRVKAKADETTMALYGPMYNIVTRPRLASGPTMSDTRAM